MWPYYKATNSAWGQGEWMAQQNNGLYPKDTVICFPFPTEF